MAGWARRLSRNTILFGFGLAGVAHETVINSPTERPYLLAVFTAWTGLPVWLAWDERRHSDSDDG